jgi:hypothetical protein
VDGHGDASELEALKSNLESRLSKSGLPDDVQRRAIDGILGKLREVASETQNWAGRVTWTSKSPEETDVGFEASEISVPMIEIEQPGPGVRERLGDATERLNDKLKQMSERVRPLQPSEKSQANFRIGINCQESSASASESTEQVDGLDSSSKVFKVQSVLKDSPAEQVGLSPGDQVERINGAPMKSVEQLVDAVQAAGSDKKKLVIEIVRKGERLEFEVEPVVMAELNFDDLRQAIPIPQFGKNGEALLDRSIPPGVPQEILKRIFPNGIPALSNGQSQFGPGWVMNREELNELRRDLKDQSQRSQSDPEVMEQLSQLQREIAELKEMVKAMNPKE